MGSNGLQTNVCNKNGLFILTVYVTARKWHNLLCLQTYE